MAQLRDKQTSEFIAEGTPLEMVLLAKKVGDEFVYDDVGGGFDPEAVLVANPDADAPSDDAVSAAIDALTVARDKLDKG